MSRNIRQNLKYLNTTYIKTLSKQNTETQLDFDLSSFHISNHFSKKNSVNNTNANTYTNSNNTSKQCTNSKIKHNNNSRKKFFSTFSKDNNLKDDKLARVKYYANQLEVNKDATPEQKQKFLDNFDAAAARGNKPADTETKKANDSNNKATAPKANKSNNATKSNETKKTENKSSGKK